MVFTPRDLYSKIECSNLETIWLNLKMFYEFANYFLLPQEFSSIQLHRFSYNFTTLFVFLISKGPKKMREAKGNCFQWLVKTDDLSSCEVLLIFDYYTLSPSSLHSPRQEPNLFNNLVVFPLYYIIHSTIYLLIHNSFSKFFGCHKFLSS